MSEIKTGTAKKNNWGRLFEKHVLNFPGTTMCFTTCYWELPRKTGRSSSCCHLKSSPTSSRYRTLYLILYLKNPVVLLVVLQLISSKWGPFSFCKSSQLPAHMLCCMLMKFPLFAIRCTLCPHPPQPPTLCHSSLPPVFVPFCPRFSLIIWSSI